MEISRYNYKLINLYVYLFPCVYVVAHRSRAGRWSMQIALGQYRRGSGALPHYFKCSHVPIKTMYFIE